MSVSVCRLADATNLKDLCGFASQLANPEILESHSQSEFSPGLVGDAEFLARLVFAPIHTDPNTGDLLPAAFGDAFTHGCSCQRTPEPEHDHSSLHDRGREKVRQDANIGKSREYVGFTLASCAGLRSLRQSDGQGRLALVCDTALKENPQHADVIALAKDKAARQFARIALCNLFGANWFTPKK